MLAVMAWAVRARAAFEIPADAATRLTGVEGRYAATSQTVANVSGQYAATSNAVTVLQGQYAATSNTATTAAADLDALEAQYAATSNTATTAAADLDALEALYAATSNAVAAIQALLAAGVDGNIVVANTTGVFHVTDGVITNTTGY
jgi:uncharacterized protein involved in exopolysaccharide biosynthesis